MSEKHQKSWKAYKDQNIHLPFVFNSRNQTPKLFQTRNPSYEQNPQKQTLKESNNEIERETLQ